MFNNIRIGTGKIIFNNYDNGAYQLENNESEYLDEDMLQIIYDGGYIIDIGWYCGLKLFVIYIIKNQNWEHPILRIEHDSFEELDQYLQIAIDTLERLNEINNSGH